MNFEVKGKIGDTFNLGWDQIDRQSSCIQKNATTYLDFQKNNFSRQSKEELLTVQLTPRHMDVKKML